MWCDKKIPRRNYVSKQIILEILQSGNGYSKTINYVYVFLIFRVAPREGAMINGLILEGARWDLTTDYIVESTRIPKELFPMRPVHIKATIKDKQDLRNIYNYPIYKIKLRRPTYVWTFNLKTQQKPSKWILACVAILFSI